MSWLTILPLALKLIGMILDKNAKSEKTKEAMRELIKEIQAEGLISQEHSEKMLNHREKLEKQIAEGKK